MFRLFLGDVHGSNLMLEQMLDQIMEDYGKDIYEIIQLGDMGYYPRTDSPPLKDYGVPQRFIRGNHEDHARLPLETAEIQEGLWGAWDYVPDGYLDENGVLYIGGAMSIDKKFRMTGPYRWHEEEQIDDWSFLDEIDLTRVNTVVTHAVSSTVVPELVQSFIPNSTAYGLQDLENRLRYINQKVEWFFGHYHSYRMMNYDPIKFRLLNIIGRKGSVFLQEIK